MFDYRIPMSIRCLVTINLVVLTLVSAFRSCAPSKNMFIWCANEDNCLRFSAGRKRFSKSPDLLFSWLKQMRRNEFHGLKLWHLVFSNWNANLSPSVIRTRVILALMMCNLAEPGAYIRGKGSGERRLVPSEGICVQQCALPPPKPILGPRVIHSGKSGLDSHYLFQCWSQGLALQMLSTLRTCAFDSSLRLNQIYTGK